jgi:hypothetical protein
MADRAGIEIDYCPQCRGVWLDRGELDKIIERSMQQEQPSRMTALPQRPPQGMVVDDDDDYKYVSGGDYKHRKRKSFLGDMFDIFD